MFDNPGTKIKNVSIFLFWIASIACVILAFVLGFERLYHSYSFISGGYYKTHFNAGIFFGFILGGPLILYVSTLFLVGFGELVENSKNSPNSPTATKILEPSSCTEDVSSPTDKTDGTENNAPPVVNKWGTDDKDDK